LDADAINPDYHAVNMVSVGSSSSTTQHHKSDPSWVPLAQVEHQLSSLVLASAPRPHINRGAPPALDCEEPWSTVRRQSNMTVLLPRPPQRAPRVDTSVPILQHFNPSKRRPPPRFVPKSEGNESFPRWGRTLPNLGQFFPHRWG
jgi:hypothetical protein